MDKRLEFVEALMDLSRASQRVAKLMTESTFGELKNDTVPSIVGDSKETINVVDYHNWPSTVSNTTKEAFDFTDLTILEFNAGSQPPIIATNQHTLTKRIDLITDDYKFKEEQPRNVHIIHYGQQKTNYDVGVIWESLEFTKDPAAILLAFKKCCRKVYVRFRPWTSQDGAFMSRTSNRAFAHLATDIDHEIKFKVIRPLASYESLIKSVGMSIEERRINTIQLSNFFMANKEVMRVIGQRTWGTISFEQVIKIMATDSVDYVLSASI